VVALQYPALPGEHFGVAVEVNLPTGEVGTGEPARLVAVVLKIPTIRHVFPEGNRVAAHLFSRVLELRLQTEGEFIRKVFWGGSLNDCVYVAQTKTLRKGLAIIKEEIEEARFPGIASIFWLCVDEGIWRSVDGKGDMGMDDPVRMIASHNLEYEHFLFLVSTILLAELRKVEKSGNQEQQ
jgi:hypothetical protein